MQLYARLSRIPFLHRYSYKFLFVSFIGIHIPLLGVTSCLFFFPEAGFTALQITFLVLAFTLVSTTVTLYLINKLTKPIVVVKDALEEYLTTQTIPDLPGHYRDEAGLLMLDVQHTIITVDKLLTEKKDTIGLLAHELRGPSNSVLSIVNLLRKEKDNREIQQYCDHINHLLSTQLELMTGMLSILQHEEAGLLGARKSEVRLGEIVQAAVNDLEGNLMRKGIAVELQFAEDLKVLVDKPSFRQVLYNLISNSIKFSHPGGLITINALLGEADDQVIVTVADEGIGFRPTYAEELFERFTHRRRWGTNNEPTNGIGLYLCRQVMRRHGGTISGSSQGEGKGSIFTLTLPDPAGSIHQAPAAYGLAAR